MTTSLTSTEYLIAGLLRAHESAREVALLERFGRLLVITERKEYCLEHGLTRERVEAFGLDLSDFIGCDTPSEIDEWCGEALVDVEGTLEDRDDCVYCDDIDEYRLTNDAYEVITRLGRYPRTEWRASDDESFYCEGTRANYCSRVFCCVEVNTQTYCLEANEDSLYYWESDGEYHFEPEPDGEDESPLGLSSYHGGRRSSVVPGESISMELELVVGSPRESFGDAVRRICDAAEDDGSLPNNGAEIIFGSVLYTKAGEKIDQLLAAIEDYDCKGYVADSPGIGFHVSVSRLGWQITDACLTRILFFVSANQTFFEGVAQRKETHWARYSHKVAGQAIRAKDKKEKYEAVSVRDRDRLEFRLFRSSVRADRLKKNIETVAAVIRFCRSAINHKDANLANFRKYLKDNAKEYPNLVSFLAEKSI